MQLTGCLLCNQMPYLRTRKRAQPSTHRTPEDKSKRHSVAVSNLISDSDNDSAVALLNSPQRVETTDANQWITADSSVEDNAGSVGLTEKQKLRRRKKSRFGYNE